MSVVGCSLITFMGKLFFRKGHVLDPNYFNQVFMQPIFVRPCQDLDLRLTSVEQAIYHCSTLGLEMLSVTIRTQTKHFISA